MSKPAKAEITGKTSITTETKRIGPKFSARYDAAGRGRRMAGWSPPSTGPNKATQGLQTIRNRSRDVKRNDWAGESGTQKWATTLIGIGITPRFKRIVSKARRQAISDLFTDFMAKADADGVLNGYGQQTLAVVSWFDAGEVFIRRRPRSVSDRLAVPLQVQLIEGEQVPIFDSDTWPGMAPGARIREGIELSVSDRRLAYWMYKRHPGDGANGKTTIGTTDLIRVPASEVQHMFEPQRPGQLRGIPPKAAIITRLKATGDYEDSVLERQRLANLFVGFLTRTIPASPTDSGYDPLTGGLIESDSAGNPLMPMQPGILQELEDGQDIKFANPPEAGTTYSDYMRTQHMGTAAGQGLPYELFSGDILNISDRTLRVIMNEFRRFAEQRQWQIVIPMMCQPIVEWFADAALLAGKVTFEELDMIKRPEHSPHGWAHIHPVQDPQGKKLEVDSGFRSRSSVIGQMGDDPDQVDDERAEDLAREEKLGLASVVAPTGKVAPVVAPAKSKPAASAVGSFPNEDLFV